jgi:cytochrome subunit of sulfide dehydrogenase
LRELPWHRRPFAGADRFDRGRPESALRAQLQAFKAETPPPGTTIMNRLAKGYTDEQIAALAKHFSQIKAQAPAAAKGKQ